MPGDSLVLIGCSAKKLSVTSEARKLYQGNLFKLSVAWAESHGHAWAVLSAFHGLVMPEDMLETYDLSLADLSKEARRQWGIRQAEKLLQGWPTATFIFLAGEYYYEAVRPFRTRVEQPLKGMGIGQRMSWLKRNAKVGVST